MFKRWLSSYKTGLFSTGYNEFSQLFLQDSLNRNALQFSNSISLSKDERIKQVNSGEKHAFVLTTKGKLYGIGMNEFGQLGLSKSSLLLNTSDKSTTNHLIERTSTLIDIDHIINQPNKVIDINNTNMEIDQQYDFITNISCGRDFSFIVTDKGDLYGCGNNLYGQLGLNSNIKYRNHFTKINLPEKVKSVSCGAFHTIILTRNHHLYVMGLNIFGQLGFDPKLMEQRVKNESYLTSNQNSKDGNSKNSNTNSKNSNDISLDDFHYIYKPLRLDHFDYLAYEGDYINQISTGACHSAFLTSNGQLNVCGFNVNGEIGIGPTQRYSFTPKQPIFRYPYPYMDDRPVIKSISCGLDHTIVVTENGNVFTTGKNDCGQLGLGDYKNRFEFNLIEDFQGEGNSTIIDAECGMSHSIFIGLPEMNNNTTKHGNTIYVSGCNRYGNLGLGDWENRTVPTKLSDRIAKSGDGISWKVFCNSHSNSTYFVQTKEKSWLKRLWDSLLMGV